MRHQEYERITNESENQIIMRLEDKWQLELQWVNKTESSDLRLKKNVKVRLISS